MQTVFSHHCLLDPSISSCKSRWTYIDFLLSKVTKFAESKQKVSDQLRIWPTVLLENNTLIFIIQNPTANKGLMVYHKGPLWGSYYSIK